jgi:hypothetical protein
MDAIRLSLAAIHTDNLDSIEAVVENSMAPGDYLPSIPRYFYKRKARSRSELGGRFQGKWGAFDYPTHQLTFLMKESPFCECPPGFRRIWRRYIIVDGVRIYPKSAKAFPMCVPE